MKLKSMEYQGENIQQDDKVSVEIRTREMDFAFTNLRVDELKRVLTYQDSYNQESWLCRAF